MATPVLRLVGALRIFDGSFVFCSPVGSNVSWSTSTDIVFRDSDVDDEGRFARRSSVRERV